MSVRRRSTSVAILAAMGLVALSPAMASADGHDQNDEDSGGTVVWEGHGQEELPCPDGIHWIFTGGDVDSATLTFNGETYEPTKHVGAVHFVTPGADSADEIDASVTYTGESQKGQLILTISNCDEFEVAPVDDEVGALQVVKEVEGEAPEGATFGFEVACDDGTEESFTLEGGEFELIEEIEAGASCSVVESDQGGADATFVDGEEGTETTVTITEDETVTVTFTNVFDEVGVGPIGDEVGALQVVKEVEGEAPEGATFGFEVACDDGTEESFTLEGGEFELIEEIEAGASCSVVESDQGGADATFVDGEEGTETTVTITEDETVTVTFTNVFDDLAIGPVAEVVEEDDDVEVLAAVQEAEDVLPVTGATTSQLAALGLLALLLGGALLLGSQPRTAPLGGSGGVWTARGRQPQPSVRRWESVVGPRATGPDAPD